MPTGLLTPLLETYPDLDTLVDRVKDMIVTGGENVYSVEVENVINKHEAVDEGGQILGVPQRAVTTVGRARDPREIAA